ncbi:MAG: hypothetical protein KatS3mg124_2247 [Porticoccaceae bacterium]|nr:MAG: hypothetical protein KatS3mg124_2247 [Porticoccaceae bacterium]
METIPLREILAGIAEDLRAVSERHPVVVDCPEGLVLRGEAKAIRSAFSNLAFNALRHNPQGCRIWLRARRSPEALVVEVVDDGVGIDPKHLPRLTERFYRADESRASTTGGSGLGLAIAKHALLRHGGSLEIESTPGKGATFRCRFPAPA